MATCNYIGADDTWSYWVTDTSYITASSTTTTSDIWTGWNASTASSTTTATSATTIWYTWNTQEVIQPAAERQRPVSYYQETRQQCKERLARERARERDNRRQQAAIRRQEAEQEKRYAELEKKKQAAEAKAKQLLLDLIGSEQLKVYEETGRLFVRGNQHDYILQKGGLVTQVGKDRVIDMCVHLAERYSYPETDNVVGLKLMLEGEDEGKVLKMANYHQHSSRDRKEELPLAACM